MEEDFKSWFLSHGGAFHPDTDIGFNSDGFFTRVRDGRDLLPGALVVSCPHALVISGLDAIHDPFLGQFDLQSVSPLLNQLVFTRIFLMKQFLLREKSLWWEYIRMLPQPDALHKFNTPLWYEPEDFAWIRGTNLELGAQRMETLWRQEFEEAASLFRWTGSEQAESWSWFVFDADQNFWWLLRRQGHFTNGQQRSLHRVVSPALRLRIQPRIKYRML